MARSSGREVELFGGEIAESGTFGALTDAVPNAKLNALMREDAGKRR